MHQVAPHVAAATVVAQVPAAFSGTLTGSYSNIHIPGFAHILSYNTSGTLSGTGSTHLRGTLIPHGSARVGRLLGVFSMHNSGGSMFLNVYQTATAGDYTYTVARARGTDSGYKGGTGDLTITQMPTFSVPYYVSGQATMTFTPG